MSSLDTTANQGRDNLIERFPDLFQLQEPGQGDFSFGDAPATGPRVTLREGVEEKDAIARIKARTGAEKVDLVQVIVGKFPVFVLGYFAMDDFSKLPIDERIRFLRELADRFRKAF